MESIKKQFPIFSKYPDLVYLDNAATTQKPTSVISAISNYYSYENANVSRGLYSLSAEITQKYTESRGTVADFLEAKSANDIAFTYGTTDAINKIAYSFVLPRLTSKSNIVITQMEHHANFLPWQKISNGKQSELRIAKLLDTGEIDIDHLSSLIDEQTVLVSVSHVSNVLGVMNPIQQIIQIAHQKGVPVLIDAAQSIATHKINVLALDVDFLTFSGHKIFAPTGIGALYVSPQYQKKIQAHFVGGGMIEYASSQETDYRTFPEVLEPGTPNIAGVIGLSAAIEFIRNNSVRSCHSEIMKITNYCLEELISLDDVMVVGDRFERHGIISFFLPKIHAHDVAQFLANDNIAVRAGHHCAQPLFQSLDLAASVRVSFSIYNDISDAEKLIQSLKSCIVYFNN